MQYRSCIAFSKENPTVILNLNKIITGKKAQNICTGKCIFEIPGIDLFFHKPENIDEEWEQKLLNSFQYFETIDECIKYLTYLSEHLYINGILLKDFYNKRISTEYINDELFDDIKHEFYDIQIAIEPDKDDPFHKPQYIWTLYIDELNTDYEFLFDINIKFENSTKYYINILACHIDNTDSIENYNNIGVDNKSRNSAFMLLRTNPKLTGNIKLVVTDDGLYLDTFKKDTNAILNKAEYRKQYVSKNGKYGEDVARVFKKVPSAILMDVNPILYNSIYSLSSSSDIYAQQYEYGAETNTDMLYSETYKILAPLHLGKNLPEYFIIFKTPHNISKRELFTDTAVNAQYFEKLLNTAEICKVFDLRNYSYIGQYLHTWNNEVLSYGQNNGCYTDFDNITNINKNRAINKTYADTWNGIAYKSGGVLASKELSRFLNSDIYNQETTNLYYLNGYQKCNLIYPNIINLEFMFNDINAESFKTYNYFGIYVTETQFSEITNIIKPSLSENNDIIYYYNNTSSKESLLLEQQISHCINNNKLIGVASADNISILNNSLSNPIDEFKRYLVQNISEQPGTCIANTECTEANLDLFKSFITLTFDHVIQVGEHFRFIHTSRKSKKTIILELIASSDERLKRFKQCPISPYVLTNQFFTENSIDDNEENENKPQIIEFYTVCFYAKSLDNNPITLAEQIQRIYKAFQKFNSHLTILSTNEHTISIASIKSNIIFQHILPHNYDSNYDYIHFFNNYHNTDLYDVHDGQIPLLSENESIEYTGIFNNPVYDTHKSRLSAIAKFLNTSSFKKYNLYEVSNNLQEIGLINKIPLCYGEDKKYKALTGINILDNINVLHAQDEYYNKITDYTIYTLISPYNVNKTLIYMNYLPMITNQKIKIYDQAHAYISLLSFINVKDFNMKLNELSLKTPIINNILSFNKNTKIDFKRNDILKKFVLYELIEGNINDLKIPVGCKFILLVDYYIIITDGNINVKKYNDIQQLSIVAGTKVKIHDYSVFLKNPEIGNCIMQSKNFLNTNNKLISPICPPLNIAWVTTGENYSHDNSILYKDMFNYDQQKIAGHFIDAGTELPVFSNIINTITNEKLSVKDYILQTGRIKKFYLNAPISIGHFRNANILEFIYNGLLFEFNIEHTLLNQIFNILTSYDNCEILMVNDYNPSLENEIIISDIEHFILFVNHKFKSDSAKLSCNNIKVLKQKDLSNIDYYWHLSPYSYEMINTMYLDAECGFLLHKTKDEHAVDRDTFAFIQPGYTIYDHITDYNNEQGFYAYFNFTKAEISSKKMFDTIYSPIYMTDYYNLKFLYNDQELIENPKLKQQLVYSTSPAERESFYNYFLKSQLYDGYNSYSVNYENLDDGILEYDIIDKNDNRLYMPFLLYKLNSSIRYYDFDNLILWAKSWLNNSITANIITANQQFEINISKNDTNDILTITGPTNNSKYCSGYIIPEFIDMFKFIDNHNIEELLQTDFSLSNIELDTISNITSYPYRESSGKKMNYGFMDKNIVSPVQLTVPFVQKNTKTKLRKENITKIENVSLAESEFSLKQNVLTSTFNENSLVLKSFFGSCCMNIPTKSINITTYSSNMANNITITEMPLQKSTTTIKDTNTSIRSISSISAKTYKVQINLTNIFVGYFSTNENFMQNWSTNNTDIVINNYIKNYILNFYNLQKSQINVYQRTSEIKEPSLMKKANPSNNKPTIDIVQDINLNDDYMLIQDLNMQISVNKANSVIATFELSTVTNTSIYLTINIPRI